MEHFQRLLGSLQQALDYVSSFTTYLLGDETHPGAEESGSRRDSKNCCSRHDGEVETARDGDISPRRHLEVFEGSLTTEITPANQEIQVTSEAAVQGAQAPQAILKSSKLSYRCEGQEKAEEKLSESAHFPADAPEPRPTTTAAAVIGSFEQRDVEGPTATGGLHQWESEGTSWIGEVQQQGALEMVAETEKKRPEEKQEWDRGPADEIEEDEEREQVETVWDEGIQQRVPVLAQLVGEQQSKLEEMAWPVEFQHSGLEEEVEDKMAEGQQLETTRDPEDEAEVEEDQQEETNMAAAREGIAQEIACRAQTEGDQEEVLGGKEEVRRSPPWEPRDEVEVARETEGDQERELEGTLCNVGIQDRAADWAEFVERQQRGQEETAKMAEGQQLEVEQNQEEEPEAEENMLQEESDAAATEEGIQQAPPSRAETEGDQEEVQEGEEGAGRCHQWEPKETVVTLKEQDGEPKGVAENRKGQQAELVGREGGQQGELEEPVRNDDTEAKEEEQEEETGEEWLESDQEGESERLAEARDLDEKALEEAGVQPRQAQETERSTQQEPMVCNASRAGMFPAEVTPLDSSAQKERVLLRRKSSIRRAPSLKKQTMDTPSEKMDIAEENTQAQPQTASRQNLRHSGFGPMHPNMMAELQMRLRKPQ
ncbi:golgin subfamily A member 6-like protein 22 isoform X2 [Rhineura floridana]|uniref:golgin subfamily A member 6-like protein 22 isoform X2 n=1 Tax=Rhineura floridana TaxID=261503 RepID=UPI002AC7EC87|nr:golgin subfamily A member 6-like protein 22 isoform X2 [Rhineura floridana]